MNFQDMINTLYLHRDKHSIKNDFGKVLLLGGCKKYPNSILISSSFASLAGVGYTSLGLPSTIYQSASSRCELTAIFEPCDKEGDYLYYNEKHLEEIIKNYSSILFGNGILDCKENEELLTYLLKNYQGNIVIDATGLNIFKRINLLSFSPNIVLTPHIGEVKRLLDINTHSRDPRDFLTYAKAYCKNNRVLMLLKSDQSVLVNDNGEEFSNSYPQTPSLSKAGSGDGLAGYIAGLLSYATKWYKKEDIILFADKMIHEAAYLSQEEESEGIANILSARNKIVQVIKTDKKRL